MISEALIGTLVDRFYARVRRNPDLGPIFEAAVTDWDAHRTLLMDFWSSVLLKTGRFHGQPVRTHKALPDLQPRHFEIWLTLFAETAHEVCPPEDAALIIDRSRKIGASLRRNVLDETAGTSPTAGPNPAPIPGPMPGGLTPYRKTPVFEATTIPTALLSEHSTKAGVWGLITVEIGTLSLTFTKTGERFELTPENPGVIEPEAPHAIAPLGPVRFQIEFWR